MVARILAIASILALCFSTASLAQEQSRFDVVMQRGKVIVGVTSEAPPFGFIDKDGELTGFEIDIAKLIAKSLFNDPSPSRIEFVKQSFAARWANVDSGVIDFGIQVTTILPERVTRVGFTRGYIDSGVVVIVKRTSPITTFKELNSAKATMAILTAPVQADRAARFFPEAKTVVFDSIAAQFTAVKSNRVDSAQLDKPVALWYAKQHPDIRILEEELTAPSSNAIFMKLGDFKWWQVLDTLVAEMIGGRLYPEYSEIYEKYFGTRPPHPKHYVEKNLAKK